MDWNDPMNALRAFLLTAMLMASLGACSSAGKCRRGEVGCACQTGNGCEPGARCVAERCTKSAAGAGGSAGAGGEGRDASAGGSDASVDCSSESFETACLSYCTVFCQHQDDYCEHSSCQPGFCAPENYAAVRPACEMPCGDDAACVRQICMDQVGTTCETFRILRADGGVVPNCFDKDPNCPLSH